MLCADAPDPFQFRLRHPKDAQGHTDMCEPYNTHWCHGAHLWWEWWVAPKDPAQLANISAWRRPYRSRGRPMVATAPDGAVPLDAPLDIEAYPDEYVWCAAVERPTSTALNCLAFLTCIWRERWIAFG